MYRVLLWVFAEWLFQVGPIIILNLQLLKLPKVIPPLNIGFPVWIQAIWLPRPAFYENIPQVSLLPQ